MPFVSCADVGSHGCAVVLGKLCVPRACHLLVASPWLARGCFLVRSFLTFCCLPELLQIVQVTALRLSGAVGYMKCAAHLRRSFIDFRRVLVCRT